MGWVKIPQLKIIIQTNRNIKIELCGNWVLLHKYKGRWEYEREREREREREMTGYDISMFLHARLRWYNAAQTNVAWDITLKNIASCKNFVFHGIFCCCFIF